MKYWLMKSEPNAYSFEDLKNEKDKTTHWDGIRNYQARNFMMKDMSIGDKVLFYHSNCKVPGVVGLATITSGSYPDHTAWDESSKYYDAKSTPDNPRWHMVDVTFDSDLKREVSLKEIKDTPALSEMKLVQRGQRLSIQPLTQTEYEMVVKMGMETDV